MRRISILMLILFTCFVSAAWPQAQPLSKHKIITFDPPGAGTGAGQGTIPYGLNPWGATIGWYLDANNVNHGFVRYPWGTITTIDAPGAGTGTGQGTLAYGMNIWGVIVGASIDAGGVWHGFVRDPWGTITTYDAPGAGTGFYDGTWISNINDWGELAGGYADSANVMWAFVLTPDGHYTPYEAPGAGKGGNFQGTDVGTMSGLNPEGMTTGWYIDANNCSHGYLRYTNGDIATFDGPKAACTNTGLGFSGTVSVSLNPEVEAVGFYSDANSVDHGFLRAPDGKITTFDAPGAGKGAGQGTVILSNNSAGAITGWYWDANSLAHGYEHTPHGKTTEFDVPGASQGTYPNCNNKAGVVAGNYVDANGANHGFLRMP